MTSPPKQDFQIQGPPNAHRVDSPASSPGFPRHLQGEKEWPRSPRTGSGRQRAASRALPLPQHGLPGQRSARSTCSHRALTYASGHEPLHAGSPGVGLGRSSYGGERREGKGRGLQATVPGEPGRGPAPQPRAGRAQDARARARSRAGSASRGAERRGAPTREVRVLPPCDHPGGGLFQWPCPTTTDLTRDAQ